MKRIRSSSCRTCALHVFASSLHTHTLSTWHIIAVTDLWDTVPVRRLLRHIGRRGSNEIYSLFRHPNRLIRLQYARSILSGTTNCLWPMRCPCEMRLIPKMWRRNRREKIDNRILHTIEPNLSYKLNGVHFESIVFDRIRTKL